MATKRNLPSWMVSSDDKSGKDDQISDHSKRKPEGNTNKRERKKCIKRMMYWMNERELVETALSVINQDKIKKPAAEDSCAGLFTTMIPETDPEETSDSDVPESAVDIAEQETVPYSEAFQRRRCSPASESAAKQRSASSAGLEKATSGLECTSKCDADQEALQMLRDIFFT